MGAEVAEQWRRRSPGKHILAIGEPFVLYGAFLNNGIFEMLERERSVRIAYAPLAECLWLFWSDVLVLLPEDRRDGFRELLETFARFMSAVSASLAEFSPYAKTPEALASLADRTAGLYCGAFGRYRIAKTLGAPGGVDGILSVSSMYENTSVLQNSLHWGLAKGRTSLPFLSLAFDGNQNENDVKKLESFVHYLRRIGGIVP